MRAIDLCDILEHRYKKGEFQCNMDSDICGNKPCDLCTVEKFENEIRADERRKFAEILAKVNWEVIKDNVDIPQFILNLAGYENEMKGGAENET